MKIYNILGRIKTDKAFLEGLAMTNSASNQKIAATAVRQAAINMSYDCADIQVMTDNFNAAGYTLPPVPTTIKCPAIQNVNIGVSGTYTVPDFSNLVKTISPNCAAITTQLPAVGTNLAEGTYTITMNAISVNCNFILVVSGTLAAEQQLKIRNFALYPNPVSNFLTVKGEFDATENVSVYNLLEQKMIDKMLISNQERIDVSKLTSGVYMIYFNVSKMNEKFIKQ